MPFSFTAESIFKTYRADFCKKLNPNDITAELYSANVISKSESEEIISAQGGQRAATVLVNILERAVMRNYKNFTTLLGILRNVGVYKQLVEEVYAELYTSQR